MGHYPSTRPVSQSHQRECLPSVDEKLLQCGLNDEAGFEVGRERSFGQLNPKFWRNLGRQIRRRTAEVNVVLAKTVAYVPPDYWRLEPNTHKGSSVADFNLNLRDRAYLGEVAYTSQWFPSVHETIGDATLFHRVQALLAAEVYQSSEFSCSGRLVSVRNLVTR